MLARTSAASPVQPRMRILLLLSLHKCAIPEGENENLGPWQRKASVNRCRHGCCGAALPFLRLYAPHTQLPVIHCRLLLAQQPRVRHSGARVSCTQSPGGEVRLAVAAGGHSGCHQSGSRRLHSVCPLPHQWPARRSAFLAHLQARWQRVQGLGPPSEL